MKNGIKAVLFDLDGTLLPMDLDAFIDGYFKIIRRVLKSENFTSDELFKGVYDSVFEMFKNDGSMTNSEMFEKSLYKKFGDEYKDIIKQIDGIYTKEYLELRALCGFNSDVAPTIKTLHDAGYRIILATNPVFPMHAAIERLSWTGADTSVFEYITCYENSRATKPSLTYYKNLIRDLNINPSDAIMVGNDTRDDMIAEEIGVDTFLVTDCLINRDGYDISRYKNGSLSDLVNYLI